MNIRTIEADYDYRMQGIIEDYKERLISNFQEIANEVDGNATLLPVGQILNLIKVTE